MAESKECKISEPTTKKSGGRKYVPCDVVGLPVGIFAVRLGVIRLRALLCAAAARSIANNTLETGNELGFVSCGLQAAGLEFIAQFLDLVEKLQGEPQSESDVFKGTPSMTQQTSTRPLLPDHRVFASHSP